MGVGLYYINVQEVWAEEGVGGLIMWQGLYYMTRTIQFYPNSVAHSIYGVAQTINSASYMYFLALEKILALGDSRGVEIYTRKGLQSASVCVCGDKRITRITGTFV